MRRGRIKSALAAIIALASFASVDAGYQKIPVRKEVTVLDVDGLPLQGIEVWISYLTLFEQERAVRESGLTDENGKVAFAGQGYREVSIYIEEAAYYRHRVKVPIIEYKNGKPVSVDEDVTLTLKSIRNPIVMVADGDFRATLPGPNIKVGYDFLKNDWAAPHGKGEHADAYFTITGTFESFENHDSLLTVEFPNEGDGLVPFEFRALEGSLLKSAHEAPLDGYVREKRTRKFSKSVVVDPDRPADIRYETVNEVGDNLGYYFRIRTVMDVNGNVASAYYGKIYGDFDFYGAHPDGSYVSARSYYLNPNINDRNVEAISGETLIPDLRHLDRPNLP